MSKSLPLPDYHLPKAEMSRRAQLLNESRWERPKMIGLGVFVGLMIAVTIWVVHFRQGVINLLTHPQDVSACVIKETLEIKK